MEAQANLPLMGAFSSPLHKDSKDVMVLCISRMSDLDGLRGGVEEGERLD
jgi:hypothetical protein